MLENIENISVSDILKETGGTLLCGREDFVIKSISTDSRENGESCLYIPIVGERFDGHDFILNALQNGCTGYLTSKDDTDAKADFAIKVSDTKKALLDIARVYHKKFNCDIISLTGSVGKTTTKEFIASVLDMKFNTIKTKANYNNEIGLPFTLFGINNTTQKAVVEMGMSNFGEISALTNCALGDVAIITNIGTSHIEYLKSREGILKAKSEIFEGLNKDGVAILNGDDDLLITLKGKLPFKTLFFGIENKDCDVVASDIKLCELSSEFKINGEEFKVNIPGIHNIYNALCAYSVAKLYNMSYEEIKNGLLNYKSDGIRQSIIEKEGVKFFNDCYNSSPQSAKSSLEVLKGLEGKRKIAILGDMKELGENSHKYHKEVGEHFAALKCDVLITLGNDAKFIAKGAHEKGVLKENIFSFDTNTEIIKKLKEFLENGDCVLIKGSHSMKMHEILENL
ncbi:MAG: UDP-N-acetylmuramoyl-tripeptide--D-alanyl-D-alanine ligase [Ruminococcaceae bacterium]|nr:UDP-N-acetylmuramoyl-tripeptide--D-alanyl-D-alanine ligase [Oscillospiraceae bacterium]